MNDRPHSFDFYGAPWATREERFRRQPNTPMYVDPELRGVVAGTAAYDAGAAAPHAPEPKIQHISYTAPVPTNIDVHDLPAPYNWDGDGAVPNELYAMAADLASAGIPGLPAQSDSQRVAEWLSNLWTALTTKGEGCGLDPQTIQLAIVNNASRGPHFVAYAIQQAARTSDVCAQLIRNPLEPPEVETTPTRTADIPTPTGTLSIPTQQKTPQKPPAKKGAALGWILGGVSLVAAVGIGWYFMYRSAKRRKNPCACSNPILVEAYETEENPYGGSRGYTSIDGGVMSEAAIVSPLVNPSKRKRGRRRRR